MNTRILIILLATVLAVVVGLTIINRLKRVSPTRYTSDLKIDRLEELSELVSLKVQISDVLCAETKGVRGAFLIAGDALISVDMAEAEIVGQDSVNRTASLLLPEPTVLNPRVDHRRTITYHVQTGWFTSSRTESRVRDEAMRKAQSLIEAAAGSPENIRRAKSNAEKTLRLLFKQLGWNMEIHWQVQPPPAAQQRLDQ